VEMHGTLSNLPRKHTRRLNVLAKRLSKNRKNKDKTKNWQQFTDWIGTPLI
jgi:hypothetical protein